jgi:RNA polymerase sigma-70 factor (ECF subfamily)
MPTSDELNELALAIAARGDRAAFATLFKHFAPRVKSFLMRSGTPPDVAEDMAQETMAAVWRKAASFDPLRAGVSTWIFTIARNLRIDHHRRQGDAFADDDLVIDDVQDPDPGAALEHRIGTMQRERAVRQALAELPEEQALVLRLSFYDEQPHGAIACQLAIPLGTVKSRIRLAAVHLRRLLERFEP